MGAPSGPYFFVSYSRADLALQRQVVAGLRQRGLKAWVDTENLVPGTPAWERELERSIRGASGVIVLLSPQANDSQWVRRELSFAEELDKRMFPIHVRGNEDDSIPLRLSAHQRVDLRNNFEGGLDELAAALSDHLGATKVIERPRPQPQPEPRERKASPAAPVLPDLRKFVWPAIVGLLGLFCLGGLALAARFIGSLDRLSPTATGVADASTPTAVTDATAVPTEPGVIPVNDPQPTGKIIYTCNVQGDELCLIQADGSHPQRLTDSYRSSNATLSPDGRSAVYVMDDGKHSEIYELDLATGKTQPLTDLKKSVGSPEISPDNRYIIFHYRSGNGNFQLWIMNRDGSQPHKFFDNGRDAHDPTWSPDGTQILFALGKGDNNQLYLLDFDGGDPRVVNDTIDTRGRSDWGGQDLISFDQGGPFRHDVYLMTVQGQDLHKVSQPDLNAQGASLSPDGKWIAFTAYTNVAAKEENSCEIFIMRLDGSDVRQLTQNSYCDYQPRWGN